MGSYQSLVAKVREIPSGWRLVPVRRFGSDGYFSGACKMDWQGRAMRPGLESDGRFGFPSQAAGTRSVAQCTSRPLARYDDTMSRLKQHSEKYLVDASGGYEQLCWGPTMVSSLQRA
jgi:hypothetical protein